MYLLDTNIVLELLLDQENADEVEHLLRSSPPGTLHLSEFSLYSLGVVLMRLKLHDVFLRALDELLIESAVRLVRLSAGQMRDIADACRDYGLDFDDAYQYVTADRDDLTVISFDADFDRTPRGRKTPAQIARV